MNKHRMWRWWRHYPLWYLGVAVAIIIAIVLVWPYRLIATYVFRRDVTPAMSDWTFVLCQFTEPMYRPNL